MRFAGKTFRRIGAACLLLFTAVRNLVGSISRTWRGEINQALGYICVHLQRHSLRSTDDQAIARQIFAVEGQLDRTCFRRPGMSAAACDSNSLCVLHLNENWHLTRALHAWRSLSQRKRAAYK